MQLLTITHLAIGALLILAAGAGLLLYAVRRKSTAPEAPAEPDQEAQRPIWRPD